jgi:c-di-GMP-binding flagellar brake protein YcgR
LEVIKILPVFTVNQRVDILLTTGPNAERYPSRVEEVSDNQLLLALPMKKSVPVLLYPDTVFYFRTVLAGTPWLFASRFLDKRLTPVPVWLCSPPFDARKIQQRSFVRLDTALEVKVRLKAISAVDAEANADAPTITATTKDISGGGLQIVTRDILPVGTQVQVEFDLAEFKVLSASAEVVRAEFDNFRKICCLGLKFVDLSERERDKIIKYIFKRHVERRQKGVGLGQ